MDIFDIALFDIVVIGGVALGGLIGFVTGFVRGGLFVLSWFGAVVATVYALPFVRPLAREYVEPDLLADIIGAAVVFVFGLVVLHLIGHIIGERVRGSRLKGLDRSLGLLAGLATPAVVICVLYLILVESLPPEWLREARTKPLVEQGALWLSRVLPSEFRYQAGNALERGGARLRGLGEAVPATERLLRPPIDGEPRTEGGYDRGERQSLDRIILNRQ